MVLTCFALRRTTRSSSLNSKRHKANASPVLPFLKLLFIITLKHVSTDSLVMPTPLLVTRLLSLFGSSDASALFPFVLATQILALPLCTENHVSAQTQCALVNRLGRGTPSASLIVPTFKIAAVQCCAKTKRDCPGLSTLKMLLSDSLLLSQLSATVLRSPIQYPKRGYLLR